MIDREYLKVNTSLNTASNANEILKDDEGNLEATIEMRLPENLFDTKGFNQQRRQRYFKLSTRNARRFTRIP